MVVMVVMVRINSVFVVVVSHQRAQCEYTYPDEINILKMGNGAVKPVQTNLRHNGNNQTGGGNGLPDIKRPKIKRRFSCHTQG